MVPTEMQTLSNPEFLLSSIILWRIRIRIMARG